MCTKNQWTKLEFLGKPTSASIINKLKPPIFSVTLDTTNHTKQDIMLQHKQRHFMKLKFWWNSEFLHNVTKWTERILNFLTFFILANIFILDLLLKQIPKINFHMCNPKSVFSIQGSYEAIIWSRIRSSGWVPNIQPIWSSSYTFNYISLLDQFNQFSYFKRKKKEKKSRVLTWHYFIHFFWQILRAKITN